MVSLTDTRTDKDLSDSDGRPGASVAPSLSYRQQLARNFPWLRWIVRDYRRYGRTSLSLYRSREDVLFVPILGMHRSGTSCVTNILALNGLYLGNDLVRANEHNPAGFWEAREAVEINEQLLSRFGCGYLYPAGNLTRFPPRLFRRANRFLRHLAVRPVVGWKDPRTTVTWPAWSELLYKTRHQLIACFRHPLEAAKSVRAIYEGMDEEEALQIWHCYNSRLLSLSEQILWVNFNAELESQIAHVCNSLRLKFDPSSLESYKPAIRRNQISEERKTGRPAIDLLYSYMLQKWRDSLGAAGREISAGASGEAGNGFPNACS